MLKKNKWLRWLILLFPIPAIYLGAILKLSNTFNAIIALVILVIAFFVENLISFNELKNTVKDLHPILDFGKDQALLKNLIENYGKLISALDTDLKSNIAINEFKNAITTLDNAANEKDFTINDIYMANSTALKMLKKDDSFMGLSALNTPELWNGNKKMKDYTELNYKKANEGVNITRCFIFDKKEDIDKMKNILEEQKNNGINVYYCLRNDVKELLDYNDLTIVNDYDFAIYVPNGEQIWQTVIRSAPGPEFCNLLKTAFDKIISHAVKV